MVAEETINKEITTSDTSSDKNNNKKIIRPIMALIETDYVLGMSKHRDMMMRLMLALQRKKEISQINHKIRLLVEIKKTTVTTEAKFHMRERFSRENQIHCMVLV